MNARSLPWANLGSRWGHPWHSMCSYLGSFPAALARAFIAMLTATGDYVLDPFCGRGTSLLEARLLERAALASDLNPIAVALTKAKSAVVTIDEVLARVRDLERGFDLALYLPDALVQDQDILLIYHPHTLAQLCYLRSRLDSRADSIDAFLVGVVLGIMHGSERQDGSSLYLSISMPNTFSMSPEYVQRYIQKNHLQRVERDVFRAIRQKLALLFRSGLPPAVPGCVAWLDAKRLLCSVEMSPFAGQVDLAFTSPPYLGVVNYARQNWIRMWFLGEDPESVQAALDDDLPIAASLEFLESSVSQIKAMLRPTGVAVMVIGDVASKTSVISLGRELIRRMNSRGTFRYIGCVSDHLNTEGKTTRIWRDTRGNATAVERILVLSDTAPAFNVEALSAYGLMGPAEAKTWSGYFDASVLERHAISFAGL